MLYTLDLKLKNIVRKIMLALGMVKPLMNKTNVALATFKTKSKECTIKCVNIVSYITHPDDVGGIIRKVVRETKVGQLFFGFGLCPKKKQTGNSRWMQNTR